MSKKKKKKKQEVYDPFEIVSGRITQDSLVTACVQSLLEARILAFAQGDHNALIQVGKGLYTVAHGEMFNEPTQFGFTASNAEAEVERESE